MTNQRLRNAMAMAHRDVSDMVSLTGVDPKTVYRWLSGRVPHPRHRRAICSLLSETEEFLWPSAGTVPEGVNVSAEVVAAYAH